MRFINWQIFKQRQDKIYFESTRHNYNTNISSKELLNRLYIEYIKKFMRRKNIKKKLYFVSQIFRINKMLWRLIILGVSDISYEAISSFFESVMKRCGVQRNISESAVLGMAGRCDILFYIFL